MKKLLFILLFIPEIISAQTFFVSGKDDRSRDHVIEKVKYEGYTIAQDSAKADYVVQLLIDGAYKVVSFKRPYTGYLRIVDNHTGTEIARSEEVKGTPSIYNGYNSAWAIFTKISKKYLADMLKKCQSK